MDKISKYLTLVVLLVVGGLLAYDKVTDITLKRKQDETKTQIEQLQKINEKLDRVMNRLNIGGQNPDNRGQVPIGATPS